MVYCNIHIQYLTISWLIECIINKVPINYNIDHEDIDSGHLIQAKRYIRNFAIIAHIDHGKTTLSDKIISTCMAIKNMQDQFLDNLSVERDRGITVKAQTIRLKYQHEGHEYILNLIDTPGHVDFSYEVNRALHACEGAILLIDAGQGIQAQTISNVKLAAGLKLIPVLNKIDLPTADVSGCTAQIKEMLHIYQAPLLVSAKANIGITELFTAIIEQIPCPSHDPRIDFQALLIDSWYDRHAGVMLLVRVFNGSIRLLEHIELMSKGKSYRVEKLGYMQGNKIEYVNQLDAGEIGVIIAGIKELSDCQTGDTIRHTKSQTPALPGFKQNRPVVFCGIFPADKADFGILSKSLEQLNINDPSFQYEPTQSAALGLGFRAGFLGMLHMDVTIQRLEQEFEVTAVITSPSVHYQVQTHNELLSVHNPSQLPAHYTEILEPMVLATIFVPNRFLGAVLQLCAAKAGVQVSQQSVDDNCMLEYTMPLREIVFDFFDHLKSDTSGYASFDYQLAGYQPANIVPLTILINGSVVDALSTFTHKDHAERIGRQMCLTLKDNMDQQQVQIAIQAAIGSRIIARETISAYRKDVTAKLYGGDRTRKDKLLQKQKAGKKRMSEMSLGKTSVSMNAIRAALNFKSRKLR